MSSDEANFYINEQVNRTLAISLKINSIGALQTGSRELKN
jgi:hypothetical protein